jgi:hypothetical protein
VDEFIAADDDADVRCHLPDTAVDGVEEHQISGAKIARINFGTGAELFGNRTRQSDAMLIEDVPDKAAAVEA